MPSKKSTAEKSTTKKNGAARARKRSASPSKNAPTRSAKAGGNGANGTSRKRKLTKKDYEKMTANEVTLLAWEAVYANRHRRLTD
jgi:hypothetical protein